MYNKKLYIITLMGIALLTLIQGCNPKTEYLSFELTQKENDIYQQFSQTRNEYLLQELTPLQVFKLWFYADKKEDDSTQYHLFNTEKMSSTYMDDVYGQAEITEEHFIQFKEETPDIFINFFTEIVSVEEDKSYGDENNLTLKFKEKDESVFLFWMQKNSSGIWKVRWEPFDAPDNYNWLRE